MAAQASLCLAWSKTPEDMFCCVVAHFVLPVFAVLHTPEEASGEEAYFLKRHMNPAGSISRKCHLTCGGVGRLLCMTSV